MGSAAAQTRKEVMAGVIAHDLVDGEWVEVGANLPVPRAGVLLAHLTRGPNMTVMLAMTKASLLNEPQIEEFELITDHRATRWAVAYYRHDELVQHMKFRQNGVFFAGALQVDPFGNSNLIGVGADHRKLSFRGPGAIGTCNATVMNGRFHLVLNTHDRRTLVPKCDFVSAFGWGAGGAERVAKYGLPGELRYVITPLCVFDFEEESRCMRLRSLHPGVEEAEVLENTGFDVVVPDEVPETPSLTAEELLVLRSRIDIAGRLREGGAVA
jgi:glutaconate CoA-transferase subunit B